MTWTRDPRETPRPLAGRGQGVGGVGPRAAMKSVRECSRDLYDAQTRRPALPPSRCARHLPREGGGIR